MPLSTKELEAQIGFPPNTGRAADEAAIRNNDMLHALIRAWLQTQGIPFKAARSALPASLATAYVNRRYLDSWRNRINPSWNLLEGIEDVADATSTNTFNMLDDALDEAERRQDATKLKETTAPTNVQAEAWLKDLYKQINSKVHSLVEDKLAKTTLRLDDTAKEGIKALARQAATERAEELAKPRVIEIQNTITGTTTNLGLQHESFHKLLRATQARDHRGFRLNIWLTGPTGSGKTTAAENAAKALSLPFGSDGSLDADYKVLGFRDANGNVISTQFLDIYEKGGIYVADEIDNWLPSALLSLNAALANGWCSSPRGLIQRHPDACVIACANTWGLGATSDYVGRTKLDAASLDRFQPKIDWPIDEKLERALAEQSGGTDLGLQWHDVVLAARAKTKAQGLKIIISPRGTFGGIALLKAGFEINEVVDMTLAAGLSPEQQKSIGLFPSAARNVFASANTNDTEIRRLIHIGQKIEAIRLYRTHYDCDLYTAKVAIEGLERELAA